MRGGGEGARRKNSHPATSRAIKRVHFNYLY
jgi:hypothetical protein